MGNNRWLIEPQPRATHYYGITEDRITADVLRNNRPLSTARW